jgi:Fe-S cluster assembly ATP-binding protein
MVGLPPAEYLNRAVDASLSGGERKRVELASVLAMKPKVAILDEPDSGIDVISLPHIMNGIAQMSKQGSAVLLITHSEEAVNIADEVSIMCAGKIINIGPPQEMCQWFRDNCQTCDHIGEPELG